MALFDRVVLSTNEHGNFIEFWPLVSIAWRRWFGVRVSLAFVTDREQGDELVQEMARYGEVVLFRGVDGIPSANYTKVARYLLAARYTGEVCLINDIDLLPLQAEYVNKVLAQRRPGEILAVGADAYFNTEHHGKFPIGYLTAEGGAFEALINPRKLAHDELVKSWKGLMVFDHKEAIDAHPAGFSDESLLRALIHLWPEKHRVRYVGREFHPYLSRVIDRCAWHIDVEKLRRGVYVEAHLLRPLRMYREKIFPLILYTLGSATENPRYWERIADAVAAAERAPTVNPPEIAYSNLMDDPKSPAHHRVNVNAAGKNRDDPRRAGMAAADEAPSDLIVDGLTRRMISSRRFLFLSGATKSGTTLLANILDLSDRVSFLRNKNGRIEEGQWVQHVYPWGSGNKDLDERYHMTETHPLASPESAIRLFRCWLRYWDFSRPILAEKSPHNIIKTRFLQALFTDCRFLVLVRNGIVQATGEALQEGRDPQTCCREWVAAYRILLGDLPYLKECLIVRYEDLANRPDPTLERICAFIGIPPLKAEGRMFEVRAFANGVERADVNPIGDMNAPHVENFLTRVDPRVQAEMIEICAPMLERFGYETRADCYRLYLERRDHRLLAFPEWDPAG